MSTTKATAKPKVKRHVAVKTHVASLRAGRQPSETQIAQLEALLNTPNPSDDDDVDMPDCE